jgi:hypothetical protein
MGMEVKYPPFRPPSRGRRKISEIPPFLMKKRDAEFCDQIEIWAKFAKEEK